MRIALFLVAALFALAAVVQWNDPDPMLWIALYGLVAVVTVRAAQGHALPWVTGGIAGAYAVAGWFALPEGAASTLGLDQFGMSSLGVEEMREALGLWISAAWLGALALGGRFSPRTRTAALLALVVATAGCAATAVPHGPYGARGDAVSVPASPPRLPLERVRVARDLPNPRGMLPRDGGELLVAVAGTGDGASSGALLLLRDRDGDGAFDERRVLLGGQESRNIVEVVRRDEVFGMAGIAEGDGDTRVSLAYFGGPSTVFTVRGDTVEPWSVVHGNINDLTFEPGRREWIGVSSSSDEVVRLQAGRGSRRIRKLPPLEGGQDPVPGYVTHDPKTGELLVSLFSGSTEGEEGGAGTELVPGAGGIVRVDPETGQMAWVVTGLTAPTDLEVGPDGRLYVLEFCAAFEGPVPDSEALWDQPTHGGFRRFSGRLLAIDRDRGSVEVLAEGLDGPTNLALSGRDLYIAQGMGTPGRPIPGPEGTVPLEGFIDKVVLPAADGSG